MKTSWFALPSLLLLLLVPALLQAAGPVPKSVGGFKLGKDITDYPEIEYANYLREVVVTDWHGFRKGIISYGVCSYPGKIVHIALKYEDPSKEFYQDLLTRYKQRFGRPTEWEGDAFGIISKWKWVFQDENGERINLTLQNNMKDQSENLGNVVKLYYPQRMEEERLCFNQQCELNKSDAEQEALRKQREPSWDYMIPR